MYLFDMDGTLIDSNDVWKDVDREFLARRGLPYTKAYYEGVAHTIFPLAAKFTKEFCNLPDSEEDIMAEWMELAKDAYAHVTVKPGVRAFLKQCKAENRRMALVTSSVPVHCRTAMEKLDLMKYFESVTFAQELGIEKKDKRLWLGVAERYGVEPETCTLFDDSLAACKGSQLIGNAALGRSEGIISSIGRCAGLSVRLRNKNFAGRAGGVAGDAGHLHVVGCESRNAHDSCHHHSGDCYYEFLFHNDYLHIYFWTGCDLSLPYPL